MVDSVGAVRLFKIMVLSEAAEGQSRGDKPLTEETDP